MTTSVQLSKCHSSPYPIIVFVLVMSSMSIKKHFHQIENAIIIKKNLFLTKTMSKTENVLMCTVKHILHKIHKIVI
jgi:hypothetical protein